MAVSELAQAPASYDTDTCMERRRRPWRPKLPDELVGRILAKVPFPQIFKARALSRSWLERFSSVASLHGSGDGDGGDEDHEAKKQSALWFQKEVGESSSDKWETYFPVFLDRCQSRAFRLGDRDPPPAAAGVAVGAPFCSAAAQPPPLCSVAQTALPSLSFLPETLLLPTCFTDPEMEGPLLCWCGGGAQKMTFHVANILTRSWKQLPRRPNALGCGFYWKKLVIQKSTQTYKAVVFCGHDRDLRVQVYDSKSQFWTTSRFHLSKSLKLLSPAVHLDGRLYMVAYHDHANLVAFDVEDKTLESLRCFSDTDRMMITNVDLVVCDGRLLIIATDGFHQGGIQVLKFDTVTEQLVEVARGPDIAAWNPRHQMRRRRRPVCDGRSIFFRMVGELMLEYNVDDDEWRWLDFPVQSWGQDFPLMSSCEWSAFSFRPGLTPFVEV